DCGVLTLGLPYKRGGSENLKIFYESVIIVEDDDDYYDDEEYLDDEYDADEYEEKAPNKAMLISEDYDDDSYDNKRVSEYIDDEPDEEIELVGNGYNSAEKSVKKEEFVEEKPVVEPTTRYTYVPQQQVVEEKIEEAPVEEEVYEEEYDTEDEEQQEEVYEQPRKLAAQQPVKQYDEQGREIKYVVEHVEDDEVVKPAKLVKLPNLVDYMISLNMSKRMKMNVCMLLLTAYHKYKHIPQEKAIVITCMRKMLTALLQG
ncbi:MAG: hypothetical protein K2J16_01725, partial [Clostridia bacterium]|nr:hypothetical protein [Clostridia bacterium]